MGQENNSTTTGKLLPFSFLVSTLTFYHPVILATRGCHHPCNRPWKLVTDFYLIDDFIFFWSHEFVKTLHQSPLIHVAQAGQALLWKRCSKPIAPHSVVSVCASASLLIPRLPCEAYFRFGFSPSLWLWPKSKPTFQILCPYQKSETKTYCEERVWGLRGGGKDT